MDQPSDGAILLEAWALIFGPLIFLVLLYYALRELPAAFRKTPEQESDEIWRLAEEQTRRARAEMPPLPPPKSREEQEAEAVAAHNKRMDELDKIADDKMKRRMKAEAEKQLRQKLNQIWGGS